jgi:hypothetical protein
MKLITGTTLLIASIILVSCDTFIEKETLYLKEKADPTCYRYVYTYNEANKLTQARLYFGERLGSITNFIYEGGKLIEAVHEVSDAKLISHTYIEYNDHGLCAKETRIISLDGIVNSPTISYFHYYPNNFLKSKSYTTNYDGYTSETIREYEWKDGNLVKETRSHLKNTLS